MTETIKASTLEEKVAAYKLIARDSLRMGLISPRLSKITRYENELLDIAEDRKNLEHLIKVETYEISKLDTEHPNYEDRKKTKEDYLKGMTERLPSYDKQVEDVNKLITEQKEGIAKIESGETKVSADALADLVDAMISKAALNGVASCKTC